MKTDILGPLTGALNSKEASAFRTSDFFTQSKWSAERTLLFDTLVADPKCTFERQEALFSDSAYLKVLVKERHRMYTELLSFLIDFSRRHPETPDPWRSLDEARVLFSNGMLEQAVESVKEGISVAEQVHDLHAQLLLREQLRSIYKLMPRGALSKEITDNDYRLDMVTKQVTNLTRYTAIFDSLSDYQLKFRVADDISVRSAMEALMADDRWPTWATPSHCRPRFALPASGHSTASSSAVWKMPSGTTTSACPSGKAALTASPTCPISTARRWPT